MGTTMIDSVRAAMKTFKAPTEYDRVHKDQCAYSFDNPESKTGLFVNMGTWQSYGEHFVGHDQAQTGQTVYLHIKHTKTPKPKPPPTQQPNDVLVIGADDYTVDKEHALVVFDGGKEVMRQPYVKGAPETIALPEFVQQVVDAVIAHAGAQRQAQVAAFVDDFEVKDSKYAQDLIQEPATKKISPDPSNWKCDESGATENLWLNLSDGFIGSGRQNWDGSGGNGAAVRHYEEMLAQGKNYPLAVKLGTITKDGGDVFSYAADENDMVKDPLLGAHLAHWGINIMSMTKTAQTMAELQVAINHSYDWSKVLEEGQELIRMYGPGHVGLKNLGNSCYMNSVVQLMCSIPETKSIFHANRDIIYQTAPHADVPTDFTTQFTKVVDGLLGERYSAKPTAVNSAAAPPPPSGSADSEGAEAGEASKRQKVEASPDVCVEPSMFKVCAASGNSEFLGGGQQDAEEYFRHLMQVMTRSKAAATERLGMIMPTWGDVTLPDLFRFEVEERLVCRQSNKVRLNAQESTVLSLPVPMEADTNASAVAAYQDKKVAWQADLANAGKTDKDMEAAIGPAQRPLVPFDQCVAAFATPETMQDYLSPATNAKGVAEKSTLLKTFPPYLVVQIRRYYVDETWQPKKRDVQVPVPDRIALEEVLRGKGLQEGEEELPKAEDAPAAPADASGGQPVAATQRVEPSAAIVEALTNMGFNENGAARACVAVGNSGTEAAMEWVLQHMEDADFNDPLPEPGAEVSAPADAAATADPEAVATLVAMGGFPEAHVVYALGQCNQMMDRAADWLFSRDASEIEAAMASQSDSGGGGGGGAGGGGAGGGGGGAVQDGKGEYELVGFISHLGSSTGSGHYVCHAKRGDKWIFFNDEKVVASLNPPKDEGYLYLFRRAQD